MITIEKTNIAAKWQTFNVVRGVISRTKAGQVEGVLELGQGVALTFICDPSGTHWIWLPEEPHFVSDESGHYKTAH